MNKIEQAFNESTNPSTFAEKYFSYLQSIFQKIDMKSIEVFINMIEKTREDNKTIYFIGNGGSAATASHFSNDLGIGTRTFQKPFRAISLTDNLPVMTAISNDYSYDDVFLLQLQTQMQEGDIVVAISASGNSKNLLKAVEWANTNGATTVGLTGFHGGKLKEMVDHTIHIPSNTGEYGPVEDCHMILDHLISSYLNYKIKQPKG